MSKKKKIMRSFKMNFISAVDNPAQEGAEAVLLKRHSADEPSTEDLSKSTGQEEVRGEESLETETITKTDKEEIMSEELQKSLDSLAARLEKAEKVAELNDVEKAYFGSLDASSQEAFLSYDAESREAAIEKSQEKDPVVYRDSNGVEYHKSDDVRLINTAKRADEAIKKAEQLTKSRHQELLKSQAKADLEFYPGEEVVKVALLDKISEIQDDSLRNSIHDMLKSHNDTLCKAFESVGHSNVSVDQGPEAELNKLAEEIAKRDGVTFEAAYGKALETEEGASLYNSRGV